MSASDPGVLTVSSVAVVPFAEVFSRAYAGTNTCTRCCGVVRTMVMVSGRARGTVVVDL